MNSIYKTYKPDGYGTISTYIMAGDAFKLIDFLVSAFYAEELHRSVDSENGSVTNCILRMGDTKFMVAQSRSDFPPTRSSFYLYVNDVDFMHQRALTYGATEIFPPDDMPYQDRQSGITDVDGNQWWISRRLIEEDYPTSAD
ncbi:MAG: VOC family protein [Bacteroidetes bacterium]|nr:VOC family protein [Bacteroidota bacterium]